MCPALRAYLAETDVVKTPGQGIDLLVVLAPRPSQVALCFADQSNLIAVFVCDSFKVFSDC